MFFWILFDRNVRYAIQQKGERVKQLIIELKTLKIVNSNALYFLDKFWHCDSLKKKHYVCVSVGGQETTSQKPFYKNRKVFQMGERTFFTKKL